MRLIIGTGGCGFQRINHIMNRLGQKTSFKISPIKMQNSFEIDFESFINSKLSNIMANDILIGHFYLNYVRDIILRDPNSKILCLKGEKEKTINSLLTHFGFRNPLIKNRNEYSRYNLNFFDDYSNHNNIESLNLYYENYYLEVEKIKSEFPNNVLIIESMIKGFQSQNPAPFFSSNKLLFSL